MLKELWEIILKILKSRSLYICILFLVMFGSLFVRVFALQIVADPETYILEYTLQSEKTRYSTATRGNIYDADGNLLAYNETTYSVKIEDTLDSGKYKNSQMNEILYKTVSIIEKYGDSLIGDFPIKYQDGQYIYSSSLSNNSRLRFLKNIYGTETLDTEEQKLSETTAAEAMEFLIGEKKYEVDTEKYGDVMSWKIAMLRYDLSLNMYQKYIATTIAKNISDSTVAAIYESSNELPGVTIGEDTQRKYNNSFYFAHILGYTGKISEEQMNELNSQLESSDVRYELNDIVGKDGIEESFELQLAGTKGYEKVNVDTMGRVQSVIEKKKAVAGSDIYLTIRSDLQIGLYHLIEQNLADILCQNIVNGMVDENNNAKWKIPIFDVYYQVINNNIVDCTIFNDADASQNEKAVYNAMAGRKDSLLSTIESQLYNDAAPALAAESKAMNEYYTYIFNLLSDSQYGVNLIPKTNLDTEDEMYKAWMRDELSLRKMLLYCIDQDWVDTSLLNVDASYIDKDTIYHSLVDFVKEYLAEDKDFIKLVYKYLISDGSISGSQVCRLLYDQEVLPFDEGTYSALISGSYPAYNFMMAQIKALTITPAMLALKPCSASVTVTEPNTGNVIAMVSYPSYDNNVFSGSIDADYWAQLNDDESSPLYARATKMRTAPGSTFKPLSATAGLEEGIIDINTPLHCGGIFTKVTPSPKCWRYPGSHGSISVVQAIRVSCNVFFYELSYRMGMMPDGNYSDEQALSRLKKYAEMYGFTSYSGVEVEENKPLFSTNSGITSYIGQGSHSYTGVQIARYVNTIASNGVNYELTLIDKIVGMDGTEQAKPEKSVEKLPVAASTISTIQSGMQNAANGYKLDSYVGFPLAAKTGTAQENAKYPDHALMISYAPLENPEISMSIILQNGYTSTYAIRLGEDIYDFYFGKTTLEQILNGTADGPAPAAPETETQAG